MTELDELLATKRETLASTARQIFDAEPSVRKREREVFEQRMNRLTAFRYFVPDEGGTTEQA